MSEMAGDHPANREVLDYLRQRAQWPVTQVDRLYAIDEWVPRTHPDLVERLQSLAPGGMPIVPWYGVPTLMGGGVIAVVALGTGWLMVRLPELPADVETVTAVPPLTDQGWWPVSPWQTETPSQEGLRRLRQLVEDALRYARTLASES